MAAITRTTDNKGRITLPKGFADHLVIIEQIDETEVRIKKARAIPEDEAWLWKNPSSLGQVLQGLREAEARGFVEGPDLEADAERFGVDRDDSSDVP